VFLFENVVGVDGEKFRGMMACGVYGASEEIFALGMGCRPEEVRAHWLDCLRHPVEPVMVEAGPVHEEVHSGKELDNLGLSEILPPVEEPGFGGTLRTTTQIVTKDPETGTRNIGQYSGHILGKKAMAVGIGHTHHGFVHWRKSRERGRPLEAAVIVGGTPNLTCAASASLPYGLDEYAVAGAIANGPVKLVKCKTVDLEVPANAEIIIEGRISTDSWGPVGSFGEYPGYMYEGTGDTVPRMEVTCISHRSRPIFTPLFVGLAPSDTSLILQHLLEATYYKFLKYDCNIPGVLDVAFPEPMGALRYCVIQIQKTHPAVVWQALYCAAGYEGVTGKIFIAVDDDVNPRDPSAVIWALSFAMQPHRDVQILTGKSPGLDPSGYPPGVTRKERTFPQPSGSSAMLIDATRKWPYPPVGLPKREYMERALAIWQEERLPGLHLKEPWFGYSLGNWQEQDEAYASLLVGGKFEEVGRMLEGKKVKPG
jgi:4-hydroxy-3-polyprenylbenzoate decarboxylase